MRILPIAVLSLGLAVAVHAGRAPVYAKLALVQAQCGQIQYAPCAPAFAFKTATAVLTGSKQPNPTCPKTSMPAEAKAGTVKMTGVTKDGAPFTGTLPSETILKTTFGNNPESACVLVGTQFTGLSLVGDLACRSGKCRANIIPIFCLPPDCADVPITTELVSFKVLDDSGNPDAAIATPGTLIAPR